MSKIVILIQEDPKFLLYTKVTKLLNVKSIDPIEYINPESHVLVNLYKNLFVDALANQLLAYLINRQPQLLVWDVINEIHGSNDEVLLVNATLLSQEDVDFISNTVDNVLTYEITKKVQPTASEIHEGILGYKRALELDATKSK